MSVNIKDDTNIKDGSEFKKMAVNLKDYYHYYQINTF